MAWNRLILRMGFYKRFSCRFALRDLITVDDLIPIAPICTVLSGSPRGPDLRHQFMEIHMVLR